jgi:hypothetical protein
MVLMFLAGMLLLGAGVSGFISDAEASSARLGSDFEDARYQRFDELSIERAQQRSRRQEIGMEVVAGAGLMVVGMVFAPVKRGKVRKQVMEQSVAPAISTVVKVLPMTPAMAIQTRYAPMRRRPNGSVYVQSQTAKSA